MTKILDKNWEDLMLKAFEMLGFDSDDLDAVKDFGCQCKDKACKCANKIADKVEEKKNDMKAYAASKFSCEYYRETIENGNYTLEIVAPGYNEKMVKVSVDPNIGTLTVTNEDYNLSDNPWYVDNISLCVLLPEGIDYKSLKKTVQNGVITIRGAVCGTEHEEVFTL